MQKHEYKCFPLNIDSFRFYGHSRQRNHHDERALWCRSRCFFLLAAAWVDPGRSALQSGENSKYWDTGQTHWCCHVMNRDSSERNRTCHIMKNLLKAIDTITVTGLMYFDLFCALAKAVAMEQRGMKLPTRQPNLYPTQFQQVLLNKTGHPKTSQADHTLVTNGSIFQPRFGRCDG